MKLQGQLAKATLVIITVVEYIILMVEMVTQELGKQTKQKDFT